MPNFIQYLLFEILNLLMMLFAIILSLGVINKLPKDVLSWIKIKDSGATEEYENLKGQVMELTKSFFKLNLS